MNIKKSQKGFTLVELLVVIGILGILMGVLFPAISAAMFTAKTSACAMNGRKLFVGITQANTEREQAGLVSVWPKGDSDATGEDDDIAGQSYSTSTDYFKELFDIENYGTDKWAPYVDGVDLSVLSGAGVPAFTGTDLQPKNVMWSVAKGLTDEMDDVIPAILTRNAAIDKLVTSGQFDGKSTDPVGVGKAGGGESDTPFANKAFVVIRKGGASEVIKAKYAKLNLVYKRQSFSFPQSSEFEYLTPGASE